MKGKLFVGFVIIWSILLVGCQKEVEEIVEEAEAEQSVYYDMQEEAVPEYRDGLAIPTGGMIYSPNLAFFGEGVYRMTVTSEADYISGAEVYWQTWNSGMQKWHAEKIQEICLEMEGVKYMLSGSFFGEGNGKFYDSVYAEVYMAPGEQNYVDGTYIGQIGKEGLQEVIGPLSEEFETEWDVKGQDTSRLFRDREGNFYKCTMWSDTIVCYDSMLKKQNEIQVPKFAYGIMQAEVDGDVYWYGCDMDNKPVVGNLKDGSIVLEELEGIATDFLATITKDNVFILADTQNVWRVENGIAKKVFQFAKNGYLLSELFYMEVNEQGDVIFWVEMDDCLTRLRMREVQKPQAKQEITMAFTYPHHALNRSVARFNRQNDLYYVSVILPKEGEGQKDFIERMQMELSMGKGPDILGHDMVEDVASLVNNGYVECMEDIFTDTSGYLTAALDTCRIDGKLYGVPYDCGFSLAVYDKEVLGERTTLTIEELMEEVRSSEANVLEEGIAGITIVQKYVLKDNSSKVYLDWERGESYLNQQAFIDVLEFAKEYADTQNGEKKNFAVSPFSTLSGIDSLRSLYSAMRGNALFLGYPRAEGNGIYVTTRQIYLNANSDCKDGAKEFLRFFVSEKEQQKYVTYDVHEDMIDQGVSYLEGYQNQFPVSLKAFDILIARKLRMDYEEDREIAEQFYFMLEYAEPNLPYTAAITDIMYEELIPFFTDDITAKEAAEKLHNRVQLYMDERIK